MRESDSSDVREPGRTEVPEPRSSGLREPDAGGGPEAGRDLRPARRRLRPSEAECRVLTPLSTCCWSRNAHPAATSRAPANPVTLYDVARLAGVSTATVSRVVHGQDRVRDSTRARVREVIDQLGYVPDGAAQSLSRRQKNVIGLVGVERLAPHQYDIESMSLLFYDEILRGVEQRIRYHNWSLLITYLREESNDDLRRLQALSGKVDGLLIGEGIVPSDELARLAERLPVVVVAGDPAEQAADVVTADNRSGSAALVTHLVEDARQAPALSRRRTAERSRRQGAQDRAQRGHPVSPWHRPRRARTADDSACRAARKPARSCLPTAARCRTPSCARTTRWPSASSRRWRSGGVRVPEELSVTGFDDIFPGSLFEPVADDGAPADAAARRASLRPAARPHRPARPADAGGAAADRARAAQELRLPAGHRSAHASASPRTPCATSRRSTACHGPALHEGRRHFPLPTAES